MNVVIAMRDIVQPALTVMTEEGEVRSVEVSAGRDGRIRTRVEFGEDSLVVPTWDPALPHAKWLGRFASDLQDQIAESASAWGQLRNYPEDWN